MVTRPFEYVVLRSMIQPLGLIEGGEAHGGASRSTLGHYAPASSSPTPPFASESTSNR